MTADDPYKALGVSPDVSDEQLRAAYRRLVQLHHPDHNRGAAESARRFEEIQDAYAQVRRLRAQAPRSRRGAAGEPASPEVDSRLSDLERELREARAARERAAKAARAAASETEGRPTDEELGYVKTGDSFSKILEDAVSDLSRWISERRKP